MDLDSEIGVLVRPKLFVSYKDKYLKYLKNNSEPWKFIVIFFIIFYFL